MIRSNERTSHDINVTNMLTKGNNNSSLREWTRETCLMLMIYTTVLIILLAIFQWHYSDAFRMISADMIYSVLEYYHADILYGWFNAWINNSL